MPGSKVKDRRRVGDHYTQKAKAEHYPARSVYKLEEADVRYGLLKPGRKVLDLGCSPGSWTLYAAAKVEPGGLVVGLDLNEPETDWPANARFVKADVLQTDPATLAPEGPFDVVLSDMAPRTTGQKSVDQARSAELARTALNWARVLLRPGGIFFFKIFQSPEADEVFEEVRSLFRTVRRIKPKSSRSFSYEIFGLGLGFKKSTFFRGEV
jgi:23S rRNA (uridine2552-2'-O)-methyltransferase